MKHFLRHFALSSSLLMLLSACDRAPEVAKVTDATPAPDVVDAAPVPKPTPAQHLTAEGTFCLVDYVSVRTTRGVIGFEPGQTVRFVSANPAKGTLVVTDGKYQFDAMPAQLTNDLDVAALAQQRDARSQNLLFAAQELARAADERSRRQTDINHASDVAKLHSGATIGGSFSHLNDSAVSVGATQSLSAYSGVSQGSPYSYLPSRDANGHIMASRQNGGGW